MVSTPWSLFGRPSIQLGVLKACLAESIPDVPVETRPLYLRVAQRVGYPIYRAISGKTWLAESVYAALLYPDLKDRAESLFHKESRGEKSLRGLRFHELCGEIEEVSAELIHSEDWGEVGLVGFSACLCQLTSSLYFIRKIKRDVPQLPVVLGGSLLIPKSVDGFFRCFPEVDYVIHGEGEIPLTQLVRALKAGAGRSESLNIPGVVCGSRPNAPDLGEFVQAEGLDQFPAPDYDDYFAVLRSFPASARFFPTLPVEGSRGCWWRRKNQALGQGCAFCNLNLQWNGYRSKGVQRFVSEIDRLTDRHQLLSVSVVDNVLPAKQSREIFSSLSDLDKDLGIFCETRANTPQELFRKMAEAGVKEVQIGIESLSSSLLGKMNKGTTAVRNLEAMKWCEEYGIENNSNLMVHFPGSEVEDVEDTLRALDFAVPFKPLRIVQFTLGFGSAVWCDPERFGIRSVGNHPNYRWLFPKEVFRSVCFITQGYRGDLGLQKRIWRPVKEKVAAWGKDYERARRENGGRSCLSYRDGGTFLIIRRKRAGEEPVLHRLTGKSREVYLLCRNSRSLKRILTTTSLAEDRLLPFLRMMVDKRLMFEEGGRYLSLAVSGGAKR